MRAPFDAAELATLLARVASLLMPASLRGEWLREWEAEIRNVAWILRDRGDRAIRVQIALWSFAAGSIRDAWWHRFHLEREESIGQIRRQTQRASFCLGSIAAVLAAIALASGFFPATRAILWPLPYEDARRVATVSRRIVSVSSHTGIRAEWIPWWRSESKTLEEIAIYNWKEYAVDRAGRNVRVAGAAVSENFFPLLGARRSDGAAFERGDFQDCSHCAVLSHDFWRRHGTRTASGRSDILLNGKLHRIAGVLDPKFWFLSRDIGVWTIGPSPAARTGVVVRLRPDANTETAESELGTIARNAGVSVWDSLIDLSPLQDRVRLVFSSFALALGLALIITLVSVRAYMPRWKAPKPSLSAGRASISALFFAAKTTMLLAVVLLAGLEFTRAPSITMLGGTDLLTEPLSTWLFLLGCMGVLSWSIHDQRRRCRVCLRRLGLAAQVGCPGCLLLNWAGTELVCLEGHGMLHVPEMVACWQESERWTSLDDSWTELFAKNS